MTPKTLAAIGSALYGPTWQTRLANALSVNDRTVRRWYAGDMPIPATLKDELLTLADRRREEIEAAIRQLERE